MEINELRNILNLENWLLKIHYNSERKKFVCILCDNDKQLFSGLGNTLLEAIEDLIETKDKIMKIRSKGIM